MCWEQLSLYHHEAISSLKDRLGMYKEEPGTLGSLFQIPLDTLAEASVTHSCGSGQNPNRPAHRALSQGPHLQRLANSNYLLD